MGAAGTRTVTIEEYLSNPAFRHSEYIKGEVVELHVGTDKHARIAARCAFKLLQFVDGKAIGSVYSELHCRLTIGGQARFRLPDVSLVCGEFEGPYLHRAPDLCVEVRSPQDSIVDQIAKFEDYFANGCKLGWLVVPEEQSVLILTPAATPRAAKLGDTLDGGDLLPGLQVPVADLFA